MDNKRKKIKYYSQNGEDFLMWKLFDYIDTGFYIEVGAFDGIHFSNTYSFEKLGWKGICIEPHPKFFPYCKKNRPGSICLNVACVGYDSAEEIGLLSGMSIDDDDIKDRYSKRKLNFQGFEKTKVKAQTLTNILDKHCLNQTIDFISIDVEGTELDVLEGLDFDRYSPGQ